MWTDEFYIEHTKPGALPKKDTPTQWRKTVLERWIRDIEWSNLHQSKSCFIAHVDILRKYYIQKKKPTHFLLTDVKPLKHPVQACHPVAKNQHYMSRVFKGWRKWLVLTPWWHLKKKKEEGIRLRSILNQLKGKLILQSRFSLVLFTSHRRWVFIVSLVRSSHKMWKPDMTSHLL